MVNINISEKALDQIRKESKKHYWEEFGGYVIVRDNIIDEIIFDMQQKNGGYVKLGFKDIIKLSEEKQEHVRGWFHKHPITNLSQMDVHTTLDLTNFWGECYTLVLQSNNKLLCIKTVKGTDIVFRTTVIVETEREEKKIFPFNYYIPRTFPPYNDFTTYPPHNIFEKPLSDYQRPDDNTIDIIPEFEQETTPNEEIKKPVLEFIDIEKQKENEIKNDTSVEIDTTEKNIKPPRKIIEQPIEGNFTKKQIKKSLNNILQSKAKPKPKKTDKSGEKP